MDSELWKKFSIENNSKDQYVRLSLSGFWV